MALARGSTGIELRMGEALGKTADWTEEQLALLRDKADAVQALSITRLPAGDFFSCRSFDALRQTVNDAADRGEVGLFEAEMERSGRSAKEISAEFRAALRTKGGR